MKHPDVSQQPQEVRPRRYQSTIEKLIVGLNEKIIKKQLTKEYAWDFIIQTIEILDE